MNNSLIFTHLIRYVGLWLSQVLLFQPIGNLLGAYYNIFIWPVFILFLPLQLNVPLAVLLGFSSGIGVDLAYGTIGIHASAGAFAGFVRPYIIGFYEPKGGYTGKEFIPSPTYFGWPWFLQVAGIFFFLFLFWYFSVDAFTFFYIGAITSKTLAAWLLTMVFVLIFTFLFNPKD